MQLIMDYITCFLTNDPLYFLYLLKILKTIEISLHQDLVIP